MELFVLFFLLLKLKSFNFDITKYATMQKLTLSLFAFLFIVSGLSAANLQLTVRLKNGDVVTENRLYRKQQLQHLMVH